MCSKSSDQTVWMSKGTFYNDGALLYLFLQENLFEPAHNKTDKKIFVTSKDSDQPVHSPSMARVLVYPSLDSCRRHMQSAKTLIRLHQCAGFAGHTSLIIGFVVCWLVCLNLMKTLKFSVFLCKR